MNRLASLMMHVRGLRPDVVAAGDVHVAERLGYLHGRLDVLELVDATLVARRLMRSIVERELNEIERELDYLDRRYRSWRLAVEGCRVYRVAHTPDTAGRCPLCGFGGRRT